MAGRLSPTASLKASTPGPRHCAPSKYTSPLTPIEPTLRPPVARLEDSPLPAGSRNARYTVPSGSVASRGNVFLGPAGGPMLLSGFRLVASVGSGAFENGPRPVGRKRCVAGA